VSKKLLIAGAAFVLGVVAVLGWLYFSGNGTESTARVFGDWKLGCPPRTVAAAECALTQDVMQGGTGVTLVHLQLVHKDAERRLLIVVPHGVLLKPGLGLIIGNAPLRVLQYQTCDTVGCIAILPLDQTTQDALQAVDAGRIVVVWRDGKDVAFPISLRGFAKGASAFGWETFKRHSWLGRYLP
jgi:invasion protein IalB